MSSQGSQPHIFMFLWWWTSFHSTMSQVKIISRVSRGKLITAPQVTIKRSSIASFQLLRRLQANRSATQQGKPSASLTSHFQFSTCRRECSPLNPEDQHWPLGKCCKYFRKNLHGSKPTSADAWQWMVAHESSALINWLILKVWEAFGGVSRHRPTAQS